MPRPYVERVSRSSRLPKDVDDDLVATAERLGMTVNAATEAAVIEWCRANRRKGHRRRAAAIKTG